VLAAALAKVPAGAPARICADRLATSTTPACELLTSWQRQHEAGGAEATISWDRLETARATPAPVSRGRGAEQVSGAA
jgi:hypothetical protein